MPDTELDPISISSDTDCEQMDEFAGDDNVDQEIYSRNDEADSMGIATRDEEINNYEISARDVSIIRMLITIEGNIGDGILRQKVQ